MNQPGPGEARKSANWMSGLALREKQRLLITSVDRAIRSHVGRVVVRDGTRDTIQAILDHS